MWNVFILMCFGVTFVSSGTTGLYENQVCNTSKNWVCKKLSECPMAQDDIRRKKTPQVCSFAGKEAVVCCPTPPPKSISQKKCAEYAKHVFELTPSPILLDEAPMLNRSTCAIDAETLIVGGEPAKPREFPHMALIGYGETDIQWKCGGSLISENFVLSAAHCSNPKNLGPASWAKLGELIQNTDEDDAEPVITKIIQRIDHPSFKRPSLYNDLSLFKLEAPVPLSKYIRPICLPDNRELPRTALVTGWGHVEFGGRGSEKLQKALLQFVSHENCSDIYKNSRQEAPQGILEDSQICAGDTGKDSCQEDSGGPLQITLVEPYCMYMQIGIISFGKFCGFYPGVYTKVSNYVPWIEKTVWPNQ